MDLLSFVKKCERVSKEQMHEKIREISLKYYVQELNVYDVIEKLMSFGVIECKSCVSA